MYQYIFYQEHILQASIVRSTQDFVVFIQTPDKFSRFKSN